MIAGYIILGILVGFILAVVFPWALLRNLERKDEGQEERVRPCSQSSHFPYRPTPRRGAAELPRPAWRVSEGVPLHPFHRRKAAGTTRQALPAPAIPAASAWRECSASPETLRLRSAIPHHFPCFSEGPPFSRRLARRLLARHARRDSALLGSRDSALLGISPAIS